MRFFCIMNYEGRHIRDFLIFEIPTLKLKDPAIEI